MRELELILYYFTKALLDALKAINYNAHAMTREIPGSNSRIMDRRGFLRLGRNAGLAYGAVRVLAACSSPEPTSHKKASRSAHPETSLAPYSFPPPDIRLLGEVDVPHVLTSTSNG